MPAVGRLGTAGAHQDHVVGFYETDGFLAEAVVDHLVQALALGGAAVAVATAEHRARFELLLRVGCPDLLDSATRQGRLVMLDAHDTLQRLLVDGTVDRGRFRTIIGPIVADAAAQTGGRARLFGEMVALLWADGRVDAAVRLEDLWNDLAATHEFDLLCAYPMQHFQREDSTAGFQRVCSRHAGILNESYRGLGDADLGGSRIVTLRNDR